MTIAYRVAFQSEDHAAAFFAKGNDYVDYWRSLYPSGVAVGTSNFCKDGGCLGLFLNRYDLYQVFKPELGGSWVEYNGATMAPTISPAPTIDGGCKNRNNFHLDKCFRKNHPRKAPSVAWESLGAVGQLSVILVTFMAVTLSTSIFLARARKRRKRGESYLGFLVRDMASAGKRRKRKKKKKRRTKNKDLEEDMMSGSKSKRSRSKSKSRTRSKSRSHRGESSKRSSSRSHRDDDRSKRSSSKRRSSSRRRDDGERSSRSSSRKRGASRDRSASRPSRKDNGDDGGQSRRQLV